MTTVCFAGATGWTAPPILAASAVDVLVDYTSAVVVGANVRAAVEAGVHVVVGSSGLSAEEYAEIDVLARSRGVGVFAAGNFSVMAAVLSRASVMAAQHLEHWEVLDYASDSKADVPSGTARELAETLAQVRRPAGAAARPRTESRPLRRRNPAGHPPGRRVPWTAPGTLLAALRRLKAGQRLWPEPGAPGRDVSPTLGPPRSS